MTAFRRLETFKGSGQMTPIGALLTPDEISRRLYI